MNLAGILDVSKLQVITEQLPLRFTNAEELTTPELLICYENRLLSDDQLFDLAKSAYGEEAPLTRMSRVYVHRDISNVFRGFDVVPLLADNVHNTLCLGYLPERKPRELPEYNNMQLRLYPIPIYLFVKYYTEVYGEAPSYVKPLSALTTWNAVVSEAITLGAADIRLYPDHEGAVVAYNVRCKDVLSPISIERKMIEDIIALQSFNAAAYITDDVTTPRYFGVDLDVNHRGRVVVVPNTYGRTMVTRVLDNDIFNKTLEDLNISPNVAKFMYGPFSDIKESGLRLMGGPTMSGKNTTMAAILHYIIQHNQKWIVSVEQPIEILIHGIQQLECKTDEEYTKTTESLIRQNPGVIYIPEMTDWCSKPVMQAAGRGTPVYSSIHLNAVPEIIDRLQDVTGHTSERLISGLHSVVHQRLFRDEEKDVLYPVSSFVYFSKRLRQRLYQKSPGQINLILQEEVDATDAGIDLDAEWENSKRENQREGLRPDALSLLLSQLKDITVGELLELITRKG